MLNPNKWCELCKAEKSHVILLLSALQILCFYNLLLIKHRGLFMLRGMFCVGIKELKWLFNLPFYFFDNFVIDKVSKVGVKLLLFSFSRIGLRPLVHLSIDNQILSCFLFILCY